MRSWIKRASFYLGADLLSRLFPFAILPLLARKLGTHEFGVYSLWLTIVTTLLIGVGFSTHNSINIAYFKQGSGWEKLTSGLISVWTCIVLVLVAIAYPVFHDLRNLVFCLFAAYSAWVFQCAVVIVHVREKIYEYALLQISRAVLLSGGPLLALLQGKVSAAEVFHYFVAAHVGLLVLAGFFLARSNIRIGFRNVNFGELKAAHAFALPMVLNAGSGWLRASYDRYILVALASATAVGIYSLGFQLGSILGIAGLSLAKVSSNYVLKYLSGNEEKERDGAAQAMKVIYFFCAVNLLIFLVFWAGLYFLFDVFFEASYSGSYEISLIVGFAFFLQSCTALLTPVFQFFHQHGIIGRLAVFLSLFSLAIVPAAVLKWTYYGAALSFLLVWMLHLSILAFALRKNFRMWLGDASLQ